jgi:hypothetical protein
MRMLRSFVAASITLCATSALAGTFPSPPLYPSFSPAKEKFITVDPPGSSDAYAVAINHKGEIAGYYNTDEDGPNHGFIRKANGTFLKFAVGKGNTDVSDMNAGGDVIGSYTDSANVTHGYMRKADGTITKFDPPNSTFTDASAINNNGEIAGDFSDNNGVHGFLRASSGTITVVDAPGSKCTYLAGINLAGAAVGSAGAADGSARAEECEASAFHGFVRDAPGNYTTFDPPGSGNTQPAAINASGAVAGIFDDSDDVRHGFIRDPSGSFTIVAPPHPSKGKRVANITGLNKAGGTVGYYDSAQIPSMKSFIRSAAGVFTPLTVPGATGTYPRAINDRLQVVGYYNTSAQHAFLRMP